VRARPVQGRADPLPDDLQLADPGTGAEPGASEPAQQRRVRGTVHLAAPAHEDSHINRPPISSRHAGRSIDFIAFTVPQYQDSEGYFAPLTELEAHPSQVYFGIVPYYPDRQAPGTTARQVHMIDRYIADWGVRTECGMGRVEPGDVPRLLDLHRAIVAEHSTS